MENKLFNNFSLSNSEIEKILKQFDEEIKIAICKTKGKNDEDCKQTIKLEIIKTLSKNRKK